MDVFEAMTTARAVRDFKPDPVPRDVIKEIIFYATRASSPQNTQLWEFIVVDDRETKDMIAKAIGEGFRRMTLQGSAPVELDSDMFSRVTSMLQRAPAVIFVGARNEYPPGAPDVRFVASACYPAGQNLIVAARALGVGAAFTMIQSSATEVIHEILAIPDNVSLALTIPIGYPDRAYAPTGRKPVDEVIHWNEF